MEHVIYSKPVNYMINVTVCAADEPVAETNKMISPANLGPGVPVSLKPQQSKTQQKLQGNSQNNVLIILSKKIYKKLSVMYK